jgi:putative transposase
VAKRVRGTRHWIHPRECLDHVIVLTEGGLRRVLAEYTMYYQKSRTHLGLAKDTPISRPVSASGSIVAVPHVGGLHHRYDRRAA